jgi:glycosyltransferase involved in cell wall biosynthesis
MRPTLVLHVITELNYGGAEQLLVNMLRQFEPISHNPFQHQVVTLYDGATPLAQQIRQMGIPVVDLQMKGSGRLTGPFRFWQLLRQERPVIIHNWLYHASLMGRILGRLAGVPIVVTARHSVQFGSIWREYLHRWTGRLDDRTILICDFMRQQEIGPAARYVTIYNGIPPIHFPVRTGARQALQTELKLPPTAVLVLTTGRLHPVKGHAEAIPALAQVVAQRPDVHFVWAGEGEERPLLEQRLARYNLTGRVHLLGNRDDVPALLTASDLFLLPSHSEGLSVAVLEAMAAGLPVVATAVGGTPELVIDGESGLLVPPRDPAALAEAILALLNDPGLAQRLGENGRYRATTQFTIQQMVQQTESLYEQLLDCR